MLEQPGPACHFSPSVNREHRDITSSHRKDEAVCVRNGVTRGTLITLPGLKRKISHPADVLRVDTLALALRQAGHVLLLLRLVGVQRVLMGRRFQMHLPYIRDQLRIVHRDTVEHVVSGHVRVERLSPITERPL